MTREKQMEVCYRDQYNSSMEMQKEFNPLYVIHDLNTATNASGLTQATGSSKEIQKQEERRKPGVPSCPSNIGLILQILPKEVMRTTRLNISAIFRYYKYKLYFHKFC